MESKILNNGYQLKPKPSLYAQIESTSENYLTIPIQKFVQQTFCSDQILMLIKAK